MNRFLKFTVCISLLGVLLSASQLFAQNTPLALYQTVVGTLEAGTSQQYFFAGQSGQVISLEVHATGELDPLLSLVDGSGLELIHNDDYAYPLSSDSLIEAITLPRTDTYTITVSGYGDSAGGYELTLSAGYSTLTTTESFTVNHGWEGADGTIEVADGQLVAHIEGANRNLLITPPDESEVISIGLSRVEITVLDGDDAWMVGFMLHKNGDNYYLIQIRHDGLWRFSKIEDNQPTVLRDWISHPNIVAGQTTFTLSALTRNHGFHFFYNDGFIGASSDTTWTEGVVGLHVASTNRQNTSIDVAFDNLLTTTPTLFSGEPILPEAIQIRDANFITLELQRRHLVDATGVQLLTVPSSTLEYSRAGINRLMLGGGQTYANFALGATVTLEAGLRGVTGCGLISRYIDEQNYILAYVDQTGSHGVSVRHGEVFEEGIFVERSVSPMQATHNMVLIGIGSTLYYYLDGILAGQLDVPEQRGQVGTAVVNYESISTTCTVSNLWVWAWGE